MKRKLSFIALAIMFSALLFSGCGDTNIFGWAHSSSSGDTASLSSEAYSALQSRDFAKALEYYSRILDSDPNNSEAIYGYSAAKLGDAGMDISTLVANLIKTQSAPASVSRLSPSIAQMASAPMGASMLPNTVINNKAKIKAAVDAVLADSKLKKIIKGLADGKIPFDNADVNINVAFCLVLRAAIKAYDLGVDFTTDYTQSGTINDTDAYRDVARDLASAYNRFLEVAEKLHLGSNAAISGIKDDVQSLFNSFVANLTGVNLSTDYFKNS